MSFETIKTEIQGALGRLTLNRPERLNAMNREMLRELVEAARWFDEQREARVVVVSGAGRAFCAGADLKDSPAFEAVPASGESWLYRREAAQYGRRMADAIEQMRATTIARLHGHIVGGGVVLAAACDLRIASEDARFSIPEIELGIPLAWGGIPRLVREIGPAMTKELVMTCRQFTPQEAQAMRFVNRVVPFDELDQNVEQLASEIIRMPSVPVVITKEHVNAVSRVMSAGLTAFADGEALLSAITDPESLQARTDYTSRRLKKKSDKSGSDDD
ncbi:MAG TPA: enoyl-CoA hydratase/isomerase family protein [Blastocatellia bacterium]|nr:enoyl-CoA hydratase/isomerase family protein [Blastocatellia bacterium]